MRQADSAAAQHLLSPFYSPLFGMKFHYDYGLRLILWRGIGSEPVFLNFYEAQELIPRNSAAYSYLDPSPQRLFKHSSSELRTCKLGRVKLSLYLLQTWQTCECDHGPVVVVDDVVPVESELSWHVVGSEIVSLLIPKCRLRFFSWITLLSITDVAESAFF